MSAASEACAELGIALTIDHAKILCTDVGNAERFVRRFQDCVRYVPAWKRWLVWNGKIWCPDDSGAIYELAKTLTREIIDAGNHGGGSDLVKFGVKSQSAERIRATVAMATTDPRVIIEPSKLDASPMLLTVRNGTLDLTTGKLQPHDRKDFVTCMIDVTYDETATCPTWLAFLDRVLAKDRDLVLFVQRAIGYSLTGSIREHVLFVLHGTGKNGKSTYTTTLQRLLGPYAVQVPETLLLATKNETHPTELTVLKGARVAIAAETPKGRAFNETRVKSLTGGDRITARGMHENFFTYDPTHKFFVCTNNRPSTTETNEAMRRRLRFIPFEVTIPEDERDPELPAKLAGELPGILAWAVRGCVDWQANGLGESKRVTDATASYFTEQDPIGRFVAECCTLDPDDFVAASDLYTAYRGWVDGEPATPKAFGDRIGELGYRSGPKKVGKRVFRARFGLCLNETGDDAKAVREGEEIPEGQLF